MDYPMDKFFFHFLQYNSFHFDNFNVERVRENDNEQFFKFSSIS